MKKKQVFEVFCIFAFLLLLSSCVPAANNKEKERFSAVGEAFKNTFIAVGEAAKKGVVVKTTCTDSDKGKFYLVKGITSGSKDYCKIDGKTLVEYYCDKGKKKDFSYKCPAGCKNGACVPAKKAAAVKTQKVAVKKEVGKTKTAVKKGVEITPKKKQQRGQLKNK